MEISEKPILGPPLPEKGGPQWDFGRHPYSYWGRLGKIMQGMPSQSLNKDEQLPYALYAWSVFPHLPHSRSFDGDWLAIDDFSLGLEEG